MLRLLLLCCIHLIGLAGCASTNTQAVYETYLAQFNAAQPHLHLNIARQDGLRISVREFGAAYRGQAPTIIMMHGFPDNQHLYDLLIPTLAQQRHVLTFDFLGWGDSDKPNPHLYNVASQRADLEAVIAHYALQEVVLVLHDLSGQSGIDWALDNPAKTAAMVLLNTYYAPMEKLVAPEAIAFYSTPGMLRDLAVWGANKSAARFQDGLSSQVSKFFTDDRARETFVPIFAHLAPGIRPAFFSSTSVLWDEVQQRAAQLPRLRQFTKPVHIIFGSKDPYLNPDVAAEFHRLFANGSLHMVSDAGHYLQLDRPEEVNRLILERLRAR
jgi:haloalkane dehalogenase